MIRDSKSVVENRVSGRGLRAGERGQNREVRGPCVWAPAAAPVHHLPQVLALCSLEASGTPSVI